MTSLLTPIRLETGAWIILFVGLAVGIGMKSDWGRKTEWGITLPAMPPATFIKPILTEPYRLPTPDTMLETSLRPLFVANRRPAPILPPTSPKPQMHKGQFLLTGTMIVDGMKFANLVEKATGKTHTLAEGKEINGIVIKEIGAIQVMLSQDEETELIILQTVKTPPGKPAASSR